MTPAPIIGCGHPEDHTDLIRCGKCLLSGNPEGCRAFLFGTSRVQFTEREEWERAKYWPLIKHYTTHPAIIRLDQFHPHDGDGGQNSMGECSYEPSVADLLDALEDDDDAQYPGPTPKGATA